jgi:hypothetical protein
MHAGNGIDVILMSELGHERRFRDAWLMSAYPPERGRHPMRRQCAPRDSVPNLVAERFEHCPLGK